jgi:TonB family protein
MASLLGLLLALAGGPGALAGPPPAPELCYLRPEQTPRLPGGAASAASIEAALRPYLHYQQPAGQPAPAATDFAVLSFIIGADGRVRGARALSALGPGFERAVLAAAARLPRFVPGRQEGQPVAVRYTLAVGATGPYAGNARTDRGSTLLPPAWPEVEKYPLAPPRLPGNVSLLTALTQRLVYPPAAGPNGYGQAPYVKLAFTVDTLGHPVDALIERSGGLAYDRAALAALAALPPFEPYRKLKRPTAARLSVSVDFPPRPAGYQPRISNQLPADPPSSSPYIISALDAEQRPAAEHGGLLFIMTVAQHYVVLPEEVRTGAVDGLVVVEAVAGLSGRVYGLRIRQGLSPACDSAALAAVRHLPLLTPGQYRGQTVPLRISLPLKFWGPNHLYEPNSAPHPATFVSSDLETYLRTNLRVPDSLRKAPQARSVDILLELGRDGKVEKTSLLRSSRPELDQEALRFGRTMPPWLPARDAQDQPVRSQVMLTLRFPPLPDPATAVPVPPAPPAPTPPATKPEQLVVEEVVYTYVEQMPELPGGGGRAAITAAVQARFRYPRGFVQAGEPGIITVSFVVGPDGRVGAARIVKGLAAAPDAAALAAVRALPRFTPGRQNGRPVAVSYTVPITVQQPVKP